MLAHQLFLEGEGAMGFEELRGWAGLFMVGFFSFGLYFRNLFKART